MNPFALPLLGGVIVYWLAALAVCDAWGWGRLCGSIDSDGYFLGQTLVMETGYFWADSRKVLYVFIYFDSRT